MAPKAEVSMQRAVIVSACRTPIGSFQGKLSRLSATQLGSVVIKEALNRTPLAGDQVDEVIMGNVLSAGLGQAPARQAALAAGLRYDVTCTTVNKVCGSGLKAVMLAAQAIMVGDAEVIVAGGMESMSNAPYLLPKARTGYRLGSGELVDSMIHDGLWDVYNQFHMGAAGEICARVLKISRAEQDNFAFLSYERARKAQMNGQFAREIVAVRASQEGSEDSLILEDDEEPKRVDVLKLPSLKPSFEKHGTITAGNASSISDGAAAVVVMGEDKARSLGIQPLARIAGFTTFGTEPAWFTTAPAKAITALLQRTDHSVAAVDLFEINEAFAVCSVAVNRELDLDLDKVNIRGGAVALGHPIGASGARILTTLIYALEDLSLKRGVASLCIGGGEAVALMVER
jgi:acetyl-CoA C-acetyltransferase